LTVPELVTNAIPITCDEALHRLTQQEIVDGLIVIGSAAKEALTATSDYDLYLVLSVMPAPLHVGLTWIEGRLTDLIFEQTAAVDRFLAQDDSASIIALPRCFSLISNYANSHGVARKKLSGISRRRIQNSCRSSRHITMPAIVPAAFARTSVWRPLLLPHMGASGRME
jgi:hypothetical protein